MTMPQNNYSEKVQRACDRLNELLPLYQRQQQLLPTVVKVHQHLLNNFCVHGRPSEQDEIAKLVPDQSPVEILHQLQQQDLIVINDDGFNEGISINGAYPFTLEQTPHQILINGHTLHAMCAVDALSIAPVFNTEVRIDSHCHVSGKALQLTQTPTAIQVRRPAETIQIGIRWQAPGTCAAHSLCREMIFLVGDDNARTWQGDEADSHELFTLSEAIALGQAFFAPLLNTSTH